MKKDTVAVFIVLGVILLTTHIEAKIKDIPDPEFKQWKKLKRKIFGLHQEIYREFIFVRNKVKVKEHNEKHRSTWKMELNQFAAMPFDQFEQIYLRTEPSQNSNSLTVEKPFVTRRKNTPGLTATSAETTNPISSCPPSEPEPTHDYSSHWKIDWRVKNSTTGLSGVSPVKNQVQCGSCWSFAALATVESAFLISQQKEYDLSEQQLVDCVYPRDGCYGGWMADAYFWIYKNGGSSLQVTSSVSSETYEKQYSASYNGQCLKKGGPVKILDIVGTPNSDCDSMRNQLRNGPLSVALFVHNDMYLYGSGLYEWNVTVPLEPGAVNHGVQLVGLDISHDNGMPHDQQHYRPNWIIKNSWGTNWGQNGFINIHPELNANLCSWGGERVIVD